VSAARFGLLDAWRGVAALAVAIYHLGDTWPGYLAVDFFLILSGFVLSHAYFFRQDDGQQRRGPLAFAWQRFARLYPMHVFALAIYALALFVTRKGNLPVYMDGTIATLLQNLTLLHNVGLNPTELAWNYASWSVSVEFWVNIVFVLFVTRTTSPWLLAGIALVGYGLVAWQTGHLDVHHRNYFGVINSGLVRGAAGFAVGILVYRAWRATAGAPRWAAWAEPVLVVLVVVVLFFRPSSTRLWDFAAVPVFVLLVYVFAFETGVFSRVLSGLRWLGTISYSVYLNQLAVLIVVETAGHLVAAPRWLVAAVYLVGLLIWSAITYRWVEEPARRWLRGNRA
jgi:peptidoglycan/LPS O-acetylase OafA/YrhL